MRRRTFLLRAAWFTGGLIAWWGTGSCKDDPPRSEPRQATSAGEAEELEEEPDEAAWSPGFFSDKEAEILGAILLRFFPRGSSVGAPDAEQARVLRFVDGQMQEPHFSGLHRMVKTGLDYADRLARREHDKGFAALGEAEQDDILARFQSGSIKGMTFPQKRFFSTLHTFALEGWLGAPKYGGNHDKVVWRWAGIDPSCGGHIHANCGGP